MANRWWRCLRLAAALLLLTGRRQAAATILTGDQTQVVQFGTYNTTLQECFFEKILAGSASPHTSTFNNVVVLPIVFVSVEMTPGIDSSGITATISSGMIGTSRNIAVEVKTSAQSFVFPNNVAVHMHCAQ